MFVPIVFYSTISRNYKILFYDIYSNKKKVLENIFEISKSDFGIYSIKSEKRNTKVTIRVLYLLVSNKCNFACKYCFMNKFNAQDKLMTKDVFDKAFCKYVKNNVYLDSVVFYGGEPLTNSELIKYGIEKIREYNTKIKITIVVNGSLINDENAKFFAKYKVNISVSIDGLKEQHDKIRVKQNGLSSFDEVIKGYFLLKEWGVNPGISCTVSKYNVNDLEKITEFFVKELKPSGIGFNLLNVDSQGNQDYFVDICLASDKLYSSYKILRKNNIFED